VTQLKANDLAYNFTLNSCSSGVVSLDKTNNKYNILYFYPKDDTSGCTLEAQDFSSLKDEFAKLGVGIYGISKDNIKSHNKFKEKYHLSVELLSDEEGIAEKYGVWVEKSMYGKKYMGIERTTFLIDNNMKIIKVWNKVKVDGHAQEVLDTCRELSSLRG